jgi:hypothetical protein
MLKPVETIQGKPLFFSVELFDCSASGENIKNACNF